MEYTFKYDVHDYIITMSLSDESYISSILHLDVCREIV